MTYRSVKSSKSRISNNFVKILESFTKCGKKLKNKELTQDYGSIVHKINRNNSEIR